MPAEFRDWVEEFIGMDAWPNNEHFGNSFRYLFEQYTKNVQTNLRTHCEKRLKKYFRIVVHELNNAILQANGYVGNHVYSEADVINALKYAHYRKDSTGGNADAQNRVGVILDQLRACGAPMDCDIRSFVNQHRFRSIRMWLNIQHEIGAFQLGFKHHHHSWSLFRKHPLYVTRPQYPEPPKVTKRGKIRPSVVLPHTLRNLVNSSTLPDTVRVSVSW